MKSLKIQPMMGRKFLSGLLGLVLLLAAGCTVGPDYIQPEALQQMPQSYRELEGWKLAQPREIADGAYWWEIYQDPLLNDLEAQANTANQDIALAEARYRQARALLRGARAEKVPNLSVGASATRNRLSANSDSGLSFSHYQLPLDLGWELDLWGRVRRGVEASEADLQASAADLAAATLSVQSELANAYFQLRVTDAQRALLEKTLGVFAKSLEITDARFQAGATTKVDVLQAETQLKIAKAQLIDLGVQRAQLEHVIALLVGRTPANFRLEREELPPEVPVIPAGLPSELLERRPDIAAAERRVAAANARIGVAKAAYYPTLRLSATGGLASTELSSLFETSSRFWSFGPLAVLPLFDGGLRKSLSESALAAYDATVASYRGTVLAAFREVEDSLAALRLLEEEAEVQSQALKGAQEVVEITTHQYEAGTQGYLNVLINQRTALDSESATLSIHGRRLAASVQLIKALGGDWSAATEL